MSSSRTFNFRPDGTLIAVSGPSGAGKTTLVNAVCSYFGELGSQIHFSVSHTTRAPREGERDGVDYHYVTREEFEAMRERGEFIESAHVHGQLYGTSRHEVEERLRRGQDVILDIDVQGARLISENPDFKQRSVMVFVFPPTFDELRRRLEARGQNSAEEIESRLEKAEGEIAHGLDFYDYVIINDDLAIAVDCLRAAVIAKKLKTSSARERLRDAAKNFKEEHRAGITRGS
jgi:guanylate kinase